MIGMWSMHSKYNGNIALETRLEKRNQCKTVQVKLKLSIGYNKKWAHKIKDNKLLKLKRGGWYILEGADLSSLSNTSKNYHGFTDPQIEFIFKFKPFSALQMNSPQCMQFVSLEFQQSIASNASCRTYISFVISVMTKWR